MDHHAMYKELGWPVLPCNLSTEQKNDGVWKKRLLPPVDWQKTEPGWRDYAKSANGYVLVTGKVSNTTVIDIDDPELPSSKELMALMDPHCGMIQQTAHGYHYVFSYSAQIAETTNTELKVDTRNKGILLLAPSKADAPDGTPVAHYNWIKREPLTSVPSEVIKYLRSKSPNYMQAVKKVLSKTEPVSDPTCVDLPWSTNADLLIKVVEALPSRHIDNYADWIRIGLIFFNELAAEGLPAWDKVSRRSGKWKEGVCAKHWATFKPKEAKIHAATLWKWLKESDPSTFRSLMPLRTDIWTLIEKTVNHNDTSNYFYSINPDAYVWSEVLGWFSLLPNNTWKGHGMDKPPALKKAIAECLQGLVNDTLTVEADLHKISVAQLGPKPYSQEVKEEFKCMQTKYERKIDPLKKAYAKYGSSEFIRGVIEFLPQTYCVPELDKKMDANINLFAFTDQVFDLESCTSRPIKSSDYISITCGFPCPSTPNPAVRASITQFLNDMFDDPAVPEYLLRIYATCLYGRNKFEEFYVLTGSGRNGKGVISDLIKNVFGEYYHAIDNSLITKKSDKKDAPCPALVDSRSKRILMATEPESTDSLQVGLIKMLTGGDDVCARALYSKDIVKFVAQFKPFLQVNVIPALNKIDKAIMKRLKIIEFPHVYVPADEVSQPYHRVVDPDIKETHCKSPAWRDEFMLMLMEKWAEVRIMKSLPTPQSVKDRNEEYQCDNNPVMEWLNECYELTRQQGDRVSGLYEAYNRYRKEQGKDTMAPVLFKQAMKFNDIEQKKIGGKAVYIGLKERCESALDCA